MRLFYRKREIQELSERLTSYCKENISLRIDKSVLIKENEKLASLIKNICELYEIPNKDFQRLKEQHGIIW